MEDFQETSFEIIAVGINKKHPTGLVDVFVFLCSEARVSAHTVKKHIDLGDYGIDPIAIRGHQDHPPQIFLACPRITDTTHSRFLGRGCDEALFSEKKGFSVKRGEAVQ